MQIKYSSASTEARDIVDLANIFKRNCLSYSRQLALGFLPVPNLMMCIHFRMPWMSGGCLVIQILPKTMNTSGHATADVNIRCVSFICYNKLTIQNGKFLLVSGYGCISLNRSIKSFSKNSSFIGCATQMPKQCGTLIRDTWGHIMTIS